MSHCLISFLGNSKLKNGVASYHMADYYFPEENKPRQSSFFGFPLQRYIQADKVVIFGTTGSMWDHLFDSDSEAYERLIYQVENNETQKETLEELRPSLEQNLGCKVQLELVPSAFQPEEQMQILSKLADAAQGATKLSLDISYSYRHMPMLTFTAALYLRHIRPNLTISGLWYGFIDGTVTRLDGLLETADWVSALQRDKLLGDYEGIADMLDREDGKSLAQNLRNASHYQNIHQEHKAKEYVRSAQRNIKQFGLTGPAALFQKTLLDRMSWASEASRYMQQRSNALSALKRKDYMRASLIGYEAFKTLQVQEYFDEQSVFDEDLRERAVGRFLDDATTQERHQFSLLNGIRNVIAHANRPDHDDPRAQKAIENAIRTQESLHRALEGCFDTLLPKD